MQSDYRGLFTSDATNVGEGGDHFRHPSTEEPMDNEDGRALTPLCSTWFPTHTEGPSHPPQLVQPAPVAIGNFAAVVAANLAGGKPGLEGIEGPGNRSGLRAPQVSSQRFPQGNPAVFCLQLL